jgi:membrane-anchored glycerophosphoryl diester phosphodiesterase (GDPDase)
MWGIGILFTGMKSLSDANAGSICHEPVTAAIVVLLFALVVVLVVLPVYATAYLEWSLKHRYIKHELQQQLAWQFPRSVFCEAAVFLSLVVSA